MNKKEILQRVQSHYKSICHSPMPEPECEALEGLCKAHDIAWDETFKLFSTEQDMEIKHLLALTLVTRRNFDSSIRVFLEERGWGQAEFDELEAEYD